MKPLRLGVVGAGSMGQHHVRICSQMPGVELVGIVEPDAVRGQQLAERYKTTLFDSYQALLDKVDAVSIVVPSSLHYAIARDFLKAGVNVLVEKPITVDVLHAQRLIELADKQGLVLQVGHLERFNPALIELRQRVKRPLMLETHRLGPRTNRNLDVGIIWDLMIHDLDIALNVVKAAVIDVSAIGHRLYSQQEDLANVRLLFQNGCVANLVASRVSGEKARTLRVMEADCTWLVDFMNQTLTRFESGATTGEPIEVAKAEPLRLELEHFVDCVLHRRKPEVSGDDGRRAVELALQATQRMRRVEDDGRGELIAVAG